MGVEFSGEPEQFPKAAQLLISPKTGVISRRHAGPDQCTSDLALPAARCCLEKGDFAPAKVEAIILSTSSPDRIQLATAARLQHLLGAVNAFAFDINSVCSGSSATAYCLIADFRVSSFHYSK